MVRRITLVLLIAAIAAGAYMHVGYSTKEDATGYNVQEKLDRVPNTDTCHAVWHTYTTYPQQFYTAYWSYKKPPNNYWLSTGIPMGGICKP